MSGRVNLDRWGPHFLAAKREGVSLTEYARSRGLSRHTGNYADGPKKEDSTSYLVYVKTQTVACGLLNSSALLMHLPPM
jgi:hypothetical protein